MMPRRDRVHPRRSRRAAAGRRRCGRAGRRGRVPVAVRAAARPRLPVLRRRACQRRAGPAQPAADGARGRCCSSSASPLIFVLQGLLFGELGSTIRDHRRAIERVLGVVTIVLGIVFLGGFGVPAARAARSTGCRGPGCSAPRCSALTFGLAWAPCLTPTLRRGVQPRVHAGLGRARRVPHASATASGSGIPFVLVALGFGWVSRGARLRPPAPAAVSGIGGGC